MRTFSEFTCFFTKSFLKYPNIDFNYLDEKNNNHSFLTKAIDEKNNHAVKILLENSSIDINLLAFSGYTAFQIACFIFPNIEILQILSKAPSFDINKYDKRRNLNAFSCSVAKKNFISMNYIIDHFPETKLNNACILIQNCILNKSFYCTEIILKYMIEHDGAKPDLILRKFKEFNQLTGDPKDEFYKLRDILHAIEGKKDGDEDSD